MRYPATQSSSNYNLAHGGKRIRNFVIGLLCIICIVYNSGYFISTTSESNGIQWLLIVTIPLFIICLRKIFLNKRLDLITIVYFVWMFLYTCSMIMNFEMLTVKSFVRPILMVTFSFSISYLVDFKIFSRYFIVFMKVTTIIALVTFAFKSVILTNITLPIVTNVNGTVYHNGIIFSFLEFAGNIKVRNNGFFWEPGLLASFLIISIVFELYFNTGKTRSFNILIFTLGILSTQSSAGYSLLPFVAILILCKNKKNSLRVVYIILIVALLVYINYESVIQYCLSINYELFSKFIETTSTGATRLNSPLVNLNIFKSYPIFGAGFYHADYIYKESMYSFNVTAQTSTSTYFMAVLGIFGAIYTCLWCLGILKIRNMNLISKIAMLCIMLIILNKEPYSDILFIYCFLFYILKENLVKKNMNISKERMT